MSLPSSPALAEPGTFELNGTIYRMSPLDGPDIVELDQWVSSQIIQLARQCVNDESDEVRRATMEAAVRVAVGASWLTDVGRPIIQTLEGMSRLIWTALRKNHRELKVGDVRNLLMQSGAIDLAMGHFRAQNKNIVGG